LWQFEWIGQFTAERTTATHLLDANLHQIFTA
jgi:hypothetical protein